MDLINKVSQISQMTVRHHAQMTALPVTFGFGHVLRCSPLGLSLSSLYFTYSDASKRGCAKTEF
ncbi:Uncharacterised protein [Porphyromonas macacae]|uniref:Uncharacterized protein n=1 Tax=Porphyromonas macacae TaxID=28115 RepID=A0A379DKG0_9PORP|nr:Uncharacterised protein [Porphyromonas macacae]